MKTQKPKFNRSNPQGIAVGDLVQPFKEGRKGQEKLTIGVVVKVRFFERNVYDPEYTDVEVYWANTSSALRQSAETLKKVSV